MHSIKIAGNSDIDLIRVLCFQVWPQTYSSIISQQQIDYMLDMMYSKTSLEKQMSDGAQFVIVYHNEEPVGFASFQKIENGLFKLHKIYVLPQQQGKGTGRFLLDYIIQQIKNKNGTALQLQVNKQNEAKSFYEKIGFVVIEECQFDIGNGFIMDDYVMKKKI